ncbi:MAG: hypothetical protein M0Z50_03095 [Planctomycetia bacterium]|nr:hypothetical protein [Planctomycetia bacterium]
MLTHSLYRVGLTLLGLTIIAGLLAATAPVTLRQPLVYEPFNYQLANGAAMNGIKTEAVGLKGQYSIGGGTGDHPEHEAVFTTPGLAVSGLPQSVGSVTIKSAGGTDKPSLSVRLNISPTAGGTLYGGYVFRNQALNGVKGYVVSALVLGTKNTSDAKANIDIANLAYGTNNGYIRVGIGGNGASAFGVGTALKLNTTYLELFKISGINATRGPVVAAEWTLSAAQFAHYRGHLTAVALNAAPTGTAADAVTQEATLSDATPQVYPRIGKTSYLSLFSYGLTVQFGALGISEKSLSEALAVK